MNHILEINDSTLPDLESLFEQIANGYGVLFLGAGASVTNKRILSSDLIELYEAKISKKIGTNDIVEFLDILESDEEFYRNGFDNFVEQQLRLLEISEEHKILASIPWHTIITSNFDVLVEQAFDSVKGTSYETLELKPIRSFKETHITTDNSQLKYFKLNGCISDKSRYPLVVSTNDFSQANKLYNPVLNNLKGLSDKIVFISIGYSYSDPLSKMLLEKFDSYNYRKRRVLYNVSPGVIESRLPYYSDKRIKIINTDFKTFFNKYDEWFDKLGKEKLKSHKNIYSSSKGSILKIPTKLELKLNNTIRQVSLTSRHVVINDKDFYLGEEPNFDTIRRGVDVKRTKLINKNIKQIKEIFNADKQTLLPLLFTKGQFCAGKTTLSYQVLLEVIKDPDLDCIAFEVLDYQSINSNCLSELFSLSNAKNIILYFNSIEINSHMRAMTDLRYELSIRDHNSYNLLFYASIRENILLRHKRTKSFSESYEVNTNANFSDEELDELIEKLKSADLVRYRDKNEKVKLRKKAIKSYNGDSFLSLISLLSEGNHKNILIDAYNQLSRNTQDAIILTSLSYRYKIPMPSGILLNLISKDWEEFRVNIIESEGKDLLIQEVKENRIGSPDLYFKTKHSIISEILITELIPKRDNQFKLYTRLINRIDNSDFNINFIIDLLKSLSRSNTFVESQTNNLYDIAFMKFRENPYFLLYYSINLQHRKSIADLEKALEHLIYAESLLEWRNDRFTHRRAVINFQLAKYYFRKEKGELDITLKYIDEAEDLFILKLTLDPFSSYSYIDYIKFLIWKNDKIDYGDEENLRINVIINELFDYSTRAVRENQSKILELQREYIENHSMITDNKSYLIELNKHYDEPDTRPYALILLYNYYTKLEVDTDKASDILNEITTYTHIEEITKFLFKHYGRRLYLADNRVKFFELIRKNGFLIDDDNLRYNYFNYVAESYNSNFRSSWNYLDNIRESYSHINPDFSQIWSDDNGQPQPFEGIIVKNKRGIYEVRVTYFPKNFYIKRRPDMSSLKLNERVSVYLRFYLFGLRAEIIETNIPGL